MSEFNISSFKKYLLFATVLIEFLLKGLSALLVTDPKYLVILSAIQWVLYAATAILFLEILFEVLEHRSKIKEDVEKITELGNESKKLVTELLEGYNSHDGTLAKLRQFMEVKSPEKYLGLLKEANEPTLWELDNYIIGWNPNWSIELSNLNKLGDRLREIQIARLKSSSIKTIEYIFLEGYEIENKNGRFGSESFLRFLERINEIASETDPKGITEYIGKYRIWKIPNKDWKDVKTPLSILIERFKNYIFIGGAKPKEDRNSMVFFINKPGFYVTDFHKYYIEVFDQNEIYDSLMQHFENIKKELENVRMKSCGVMYDTTKKEFKFDDCVNNIPQESHSVISDGNQPIAITEPVDNAMETTPTELILHPKSD